MKRGSPTIRTVVRKLILIIFLLAPHLLYAQGKEALLIDSLLKVLPALPDDTNKVKLLCDLSHTYFIVNISEGFRRGNEALALAEKLGWEKGIAKAYSSLGTNYWANNEFLKAQDFYLKSLKIYEATGDKRTIAKALHRVGTNYSSQSDKSKALLYLERALRLFEETNDSAAIFGCNLNIGGLYHEQNKTVLALQYYNKAVQIAELMGRKRDYAYALNLIGRAFASQKNHSKALEFEEKSIRAFESIGQNNDLAIQYGNAGEVFLMLEDYELSLPNFKKAIKVFTRVKNRGETAYYGSWYGYIGKIQVIQYKERKKAGLTGNKELLDLAIINLKKGVSICESVVTAWGYLVEFNSALSEAFALKGDYLSALRYLKKAGIYTDSLHTAEKQDQMLKLELEYEYNKKKDSLDYLSGLQNVQIQNEKKLSRFALRQQWLFSIVLLVLLCLLGSYFLFRYRVKQLRLKNELIREKAEKKLKEAEYQRRINDITFSALRSQMNPHFIFNALNTIQSYIYANDKQSASNYLGKFSDLIRKILDNSNKQKITLEEEIHVLQLYIDIEKARFGDTFNAVIEMDPGLDAENIYLPPMLIQPYTENAIKHGLLHQAGEKRLLVQISKSADQQYIEISIEDNGIGREKSAEINKNRGDHSSFANAANERRIDLINQLHDKKTSLKIIDKKNTDGTAAGTTVIINIPVMAVRIA